MTNSEHQLRLTLKQAGYDDAAISAVWPEWWSKEAAESVSAQAELRFSVARRLGLDPRNLLEDNDPVFVWKGESKFKHLRNTTEWEREALCSFGISVGRSLIEARSKEPTELFGLEACDLRTALLINRPFVDLVDLLSLCWSVGIPVIQLKVFPANRKRMSAMCVRVGSGFAILIGKSANYPAPISFYIAHELAHIVLGHLGESSALMDMENPTADAEESDTEELAADRWALELLTGMSAPQVSSTIPNFNAAQLADNVWRSGPQLAVEPGMLAFCCGFTTGRWPVVMAALPLIYGEPHPVWKVVNSTAEKQLSWSDLTPSTNNFLRTVMGLHI